VTIASTELLRERHFLLEYYVDDIVLVAKSEKPLKEVKKSLAKHFDIKDMGRLHFFLGMEVIQNEESNQVWIGQPAYTKNLFLILRMTFKNLEWRMLNL